MAKVSIIIPIYNVEKYLSKTIDSVVNQTEKDIEIVLVDDGSTDRSGKICDEYAQKDERIKVIHKVNGGLSSARNAGIKVAKAEYIMLLDGDDFLNIHAVSILEKAIVQYPSDFIQFHYQEIKETDIDYNEMIEEEIYRAQTLKELYDNLYRIGGEAASACTKLYRSDLYGLVGLANSFINYINVITAALNSMASRFIIIELHKKNTEKANTYYSSVLIANTLFAFMEDCS